MAIFGARKATHPMEDRKEARALIADFPKNDASKALDEATYWLDSVSQAEEIKLDYRFELYDLLDQAGRIHQRKLSKDYLYTNRQEKFRENKLWSTIFEYWKTLSRCYSQCISEFEAGGKGGKIVEKNLTVVVSRALRALTQQLKWSELRYGPVENRIWADLGRLYLFAESRNIASTPATIYPGQQAHGTVQEEFLKALALSISSIDGLTPIKQEIAEKTIAHFASLFEIHAVQTSACNYFFDLSLPKPAARVLKRVEASPTIRYFGAGKAFPALLQLISEIKTKKCLPSNINFGGNYEFDIVYSVAMHLAAYWSDKAPARSSERRKTATRLTVVNGFKQIVRCIKPVGEGEASDLQIENLGESWIVENVSDGGFGAIVPQVKSEWLQIGSVLGLRAETSNLWGVGIVRRLTRDEYHQRRVGIQLISKAVIPVLLSKSSSVLAADVLGGGEAAVLLSTSPDENGEVGLLLRAGVFSSAMPLNMNVHEKHYGLAPRKLVDGGEDFDWAKFGIAHAE
jgi:hypothetical protein